MKRVAIYGGSFNPPHLGHIALARYVIASGRADEVWLMVSPKNPLKAADGLLPTPQRLRLAALAAEGEEGIRVSDFETHLPIPSYTFKTLRALREQYPDLEFCLLVGADNWQVFSSWAHPEEILRHHRLLVYPREGYPIDAASLPDGVELIDAPLFPVSSTEVRQLVREGKSVEHLVGKAVAEAIEREGLYLG